eukprot:COSAG01_NODE_38748_length_485_cov_8.686528_1_plen_71_part_00
MLTLLLHRLIKQCVEAFRRAQILSAESGSSAYGESLQFRLERRVITSMTTVRYECDRCCKRRVKAGLVPT